MSTDIYSIYKTTNILFPTKHYIGYDSNWPQRQKDHYKDSYNKNQPQYWYQIHIALREFGKDQFSWEIIYQSKSLEDIKQKEKDFIIEYNSHYIKGIGYNMTDGGEGTTGYIHTKESREKWRESNHGLKGQYNPFFGKHHTKETCEQIGEKNTGNIAWNKGLKGSKGETNPASKLTEIQVIEIKKLFQEKPIINDERIGKTQRNGKIFPYDRAFCFFYGEIYGVSHKTIDLIITNKKWKYL